MLSGDALAEDIWNVPAGAELLDDVYTFLGRFVSYPGEHARVAHTLWCAHTHLIDASESSPRIAFLSPEPESGKSRALEVTDLLVPRPEHAVNLTPSYIYRSISDPDGKPTILFDEIDAIFGPRAKEHEDVRGLLNSGHRRGAEVGRCVPRGQSFDLQKFPVFAAVALAGLGDLPDTLLSRSIIIRMRRRAPGERVEPFRYRLHRDEGEQLRDRLAQWAADVEASLTGAWPQMPEGVTDRPADCWEPLLAIAEAAGGAWPERARVACVTHVTDNKESTPSLGIKLLSDLRDVFGDSDHLATTTILEELCRLEDSPWGDLKGKPLDARGLARRLRKYHVRRETVRIGDATAKGYTRQGLWDAWQRYLPPIDKDAAGEAGPGDAHAFPNASVTSVTSETSRRREVLAPGETGDEPAPGWAE